MCGIAGILNIDENLSINSAWLERMGATMFHRGPDDAGIAQPDSHVALVSQRLAILDLSPCGHMPMQTRDGHLWIAYNGEVYNFQEIRAELEQVGYTFRSQGDTEVLLYAYQEWGDAFLERLNGMFALAIWDSRANELTLARDRIGIKPLYFYNDNKRLVFASELHTITRSGISDLNLDVSSDAIDQFFTFGYFPAPTTILDKVQKLKPGHLAKVRDASIEIRPYWQAQFESKSGGDEKQYLEELDALLVSSVKHRLISDVPLGAFLSGGVDSSIVAAIAARESGSKLKTFSIGYGRKDYDESRYAEKVADYLGTDHHSLIIDEDDIADDIVRIIKSFDEPLYDSSAVPTYFVSRLAREHVTVSLSGDGGDELFFGYGHLQRDARMYESRQRWQALKNPSLSGLALSLVPRPLLDFSFRGARKLGQRINFDLDNKVMLRAAGTLWHSEYRDWPDYYVHERSRLTPDVRRSLLASKQLSSSSGDVFRSYYQAQTSNQSEARLSGVELSVYLPNDILTKVDRMSMLNSLESRVPLLDHRVVEFAAKLPMEYKVRGNSQKWILKKYLEKLYPDEAIRKTITRKKHGFSFPFRHYLLTTLRDLAWDSLRDPAFVDAMHLDLSGVEELLEEAYANPAGTGLLGVWLLLNLRLWWDKHLEPIQQQTTPITTAARADNVRLEM